MNSFLIDQLTTEAKAELQTEIYLIELRDSFARSAMQGILASWNRGNSGRLLVEDAIADDAYVIADAMLKRREKP